MKKILFPFDTRNNNNDAFCYAATLARRQTAKLVMLNPFIIDQVDDAVTKNHLARLTKARWKEAIDEIFKIKGFYIDKFAHSEGDLKLQTGYRIIMGPFRQTVLETLSKEQFDLVVLTWPEYASEERDGLASLAKEILETIGTSVLFVPEEVDLSNIHHIAYATDLEPLNDSKALIEESRRIARLFDASMDFISLSRDGSLREIGDQETLDYIRKLTVTSERYQLEVLEGIDIVEEIEKYCENSEVGLLIAVKRKRGFLGNLFHTSFTGRLVNSLKVPVLIMRDPIPVAESLKTITL